MNKTNMAVGISDSNIIVKGAMAHLAVLRCPACNYRHGSHSADTLFISWRCKSCKSNVATSVSSGVMVGGMHGNDEITYENFVKMNSII